MNRYDKMAKDELKKVRDQIDFVIRNMDDGDEFVSSAIGIVIEVNRFREVKHHLTLAREL